MIRHLCTNCFTEVRPDDIVDGDTHAVVVIRTRTGSAHAPGCSGDCDRHGCPIPVPEPYEDQEPCGPVFPFMVDNEHLAQVREWHETFGVPVRAFPTADIPPEEAAMRVRIIEEELTELGLAVATRNIVEIADAIADLLVTVYGAALAFGIPIEEVMREVHRSNMTKRAPDGSVVRRDDGKIVKGPHFEPPDIARIIREAEAPF